MKRQSQTSSLLWQKVQMCGIQQECKKIAQNPVYQAFGSCAKMHVSNFKEFQGYTPVSPLKTEMEGMGDNHTMTWRQRSEREAGKQGRITDRITGERRV